MDYRHIFVYKLKSARPTYYLVFDIILLNEIENDIEDFVVITLGLYLHVIFDKKCTSIMTSSEIEFVTLVFSVFHVEYLFHFRICTVSWRLWTQSKVSGSFIIE